MSPALRLSTAAFAIAVMTAASAAAAAGTRFFSYDPADSVTQHLTRGVTLEVEVGPLGGLFGGGRVRGLYATSASGSARLEYVGDRAARAALPADAAESNVYRILPEGDGRALGRALCAGSDEAFLVMGRVRRGEPLVMHAVGRAGDQPPRLCASLRYDFRGEWSMPDNDRPQGGDAPGPRLGR